MVKKNTLNLEKSLSKLEKIVGELEAGELPLETAMKKFEEGVKLTRTCQSFLKDAEQKVKILIKNSKNNDELQYFTDKT
jgi:exodeoxyribonuclease VII small subunit|tara:strand:- start:998 stop:1234 length:237 start_codon:yes stop_codon:yes gene_type:complete